MRTRIGGPPEGGSSEKGPTGAGYEHECRLKGCSPERAREVEALMRLHCLPGVGTRTLWRILERFGSGVAALQAPSARLGATVGPGTSAALNSSELNERVDHARARYNAFDMAVLTWRDTGYPERLLQLTDPPPPPLLFGRGDLGLLSGAAVTVVGSRRSTPYGRRVAERLAAELSVQGVVVVSGLALGIDGSAHRGALEAGGDTIAVLGSGVDLIQPASHRVLGNRIVREGLLLSEFLPGEPARAHHFPRRNRILAALASAVVVVEAGERSGAFITVEHALDLGRDVYAVPGPVDAAQSRGCNTLLRQGAHVITSAKDFVRDLGLAGVGHYAGGREGGDGGGSSSSGEALRRAERAQHLRPDARRVWEALDEQPVRIEELASITRLDPGSVLAVLTELEVTGWVAQEAGMRFRKAS